jgi:hypothetical protein
MRTSPGGWSAREESALGRTDRYVTSQQTLIPRGDDGIVGSGATTARFDQLDRALELLTGKMADGYVNVDHRPDSVADLLEVRVLLR